MTTAPTHTVTYTVSGISRPIVQHFADEATARRFVSKVIRTGATTAVVSAR